MVSCCRTVLAVFTVPLMIMMVAIATKIKIKELCLLHAGQQQSKYFTHKDNSLNPPMSRKQMTIITSIWHVETDRGQVIHPDSNCLPVMGQAEHRWCIKMGHLGDYLQNVGLKEALGNPGAGQFMSPTGFHGWEKSSQNSWILWDLWPGVVLRQRLCRAWKSFRERTGRQAPPHPVCPPSAC